MDRECWILSYKSKVQIQPKLKVKIQGHRVLITGKAERWRNFQLLTQDAENTSTLIGIREKTNIFTRQDFLKTLQRGGDKARPTNWEQAKAVYSEVAIARVSHHKLHFSKDSWRAEEWGSFIVEKRRLLVCPDWRLLVWGSYSQTDWKWGILGDWWRTTAGLCIDSWVALLWYIPGIL